MRVLEGLVRSGSSLEQLFTLFASTVHSFVVVRSFFFAMPAVVLVSGMSGAGKSTLAELLCEKYGLIHFDADCWTVGRDPVAEAGATITPADFQAAPEKVPCPPSLFSLAFPTCSLMFYPV